MRRSIMGLLGIAAATTIAVAGIAQTPQPAQPASFDFESLKGRPNLDQTPLGSSGQWSLEKLLALTQAEGIALWRTLPAVPMNEMDGHYMGLGPDAKDLAYQKGYADFMFNEHSPRGYWLGKAFRPLTATTGEGYNRWRFPGGRIERNLRMATHMGTSLIDGNPAYVLDYGAFSKGSTLIDEVRKLDDSIYLGAATVDGGGGTRSKPDFFILIGPTDEWVGPKVSP